MSLPLPLGSAGPYELRTRLAAGGMGEVFLAADRSVEGVERLVVVKRLFDSFARQAAVAAMFEHEAWLLSAMAHPIIPQVYAYGRHERAPYIAMEYSPGTDLSAVLAGGAPVPLEHAIAIAVQLLEGLAHVHERPGSDGRPLEVVHRDVSPGNIRLGPDGWLTLLDFGVAQSTLRPAARDDTRGCPGYIAPEVILGEVPDARADLFAATVVLHEMLAGERLFPGGALPAMQATMEAEIAPPSRRVPSIPPRVDELVLRGLARDPGARFATADAMVAALEDAALAAGVNPSRRRLAAWLGTAPKAT
ncbi:MAG: serine/threonine-protein kinase [Deltaproteobacteria bacterium]